MTNTMTCRKCEAPDTITIKKSYSYCETCYINVINHKFRSCIGKNKVIKPNENVLVGLSGGSSSTVLLDLIHAGVTLNTHKKLRIQPHFVHLTDDSDISAQVANAVIDQTKKYGYNVRLINTLSYSAINTKADASNNHSQLNFGLFNCDLTSLQSTTSKDLNARIKQNIMASVAKEIKCTIIFTAETATNLASKLLSDLVIGRGSQVEHEVGFLDDRYGEIKILRPLREITREEIVHYVNIKCLDPMCNNKVQNNSLQSVIDNFVLKLDEDTPATISTICKTADKIGSERSNESEKRCVFCKGKLDKDVNKLTAVQATIFSRKVSFISTKEYETEKDHLKNADEENTNVDLFPYIYNYLCYCCSRNYAETNLVHDIKKS